MKQNYSIKDFAPSAKTLDTIRQFAHTYHPKQEVDICTPIYLMTLKK